MNQVEEFPANGVVRGLFTLDDALDVSDDGVQHDLQLGCAFGNASKVRDRVHLTHLGELGLLEQVKTGHLSLVGRYVYRYRCEHRATCGAGNTNGSAEEEVIQM